MDVKTQLVKVHNNDNVAVATCPIVAGTTSLNMTLQLAKTFLLAIKLP